MRTEKWLQTAMLNALPRKLREKEAKWIYPWTRRTALSPTFLWQMIQVRSSGYLLIQYKFHGPDNNTVRAHQSADPSYEVQCVFRKYPHVPALF